MSDVAVNFASLFQIQSMFGSASVSGFTSEVWASQPEKGGNHPTWILAHITMQRRVIARNLGATIPEEKREGEVAFGSECLPASQYPSPEELLEEFSTLGQDISKRLSEADDSVWSAEFQPVFPDGRSRSVREALGFMITHEGIHIGQLSYIRRLHGLPGLADVVLKMMAAN